MKDDYLLEVGDVIRERNAFGGGDYPVTRVTANFAFCRIHETYEAKYKRLVSDFYGVRPVPRIEWDMTRRKVIRKP